MLRVWQVRDFFTRYMMQRSFAYALTVCAAAWVVAAIPAAADAQESSPTVLLGQVDPLGIPEWRAWAAFYGSLDFYRRRSAVDVDRLLTARVGLRSSDTDPLLATGAAFVNTIRHIDSAARAELEVQYGKPRPRTATVPPPTGTKPLPPGALLVVEPGKTVYQAVRESGLYDAVEKQKAEALDRHISDLERSIGPSSISRLRHFIQTTVTPQIQTGVSRQTTPPLPRIERPAPTLLTAPLD